MNKEIKFGHTGGFPLVQDTLNFTQEGIKTLSALAIALSSQEGCNTLIVDGGRRNGDVISPGVVVINGEVLPFEGGEIDDHVIIKETKQTAIFKDGEGHDVYVTRSAVFGSGAEEVSWKEFKRIGTDYEYDYVVDSHQSLVNLNNNPNVKNVLVKRGVWRSTGGIVLTGVRNIRGEDGAAIVMYGNAGLRSTGCSLDNLSIRFTSSAGTRTLGMTGFHGIRNCNIEVNMNGAWEEDNQASLLQDCTEIINSSIEHTGSQYKKLVESCDKIVNCSFTSQRGGGVVDGVEDVVRCKFKNVNIGFGRRINSCEFESITSEWAISDSYEVLSCHYIGQHTTPYQNSYASSGNQYRCADTPEGGYNSKRAML